MTYDNFTIGCNQTVTLNTLNSTELDEPTYNNIRIFTEIKVILDNLTFKWSDESFFIEWSVLVQKCRERIRDYKKRGVPKRSHSKIKKRENICVVG